MSPYRRNVLVGITVLAALAMLGWMMLRFGAALVWPFAPRYMEVRLRSDRGDGLADGSPMFYKGVQAGRVRSVTRSPDGMYVLINAQLFESPPLPANLHGEIRLSSLIGGQTGVHMELTGPMPEGRLAPGDQLDARYAADLLPPELIELARELRDATRQFRESNLINHLDDQVQHLGKVLDSFQQIIDDPKMREDLKASLANIRSMTEKTDRIAGRLEKLSDEASETLTQARGAIGRTENELVGLSHQIGERLTQFGRLADQFQSITGKIDQGQGTAGQFVNDPKLYEALVDTAREMRATVTDLRRLVQQWEQEGVSLKLK